MCGRANFNSLNSPSDKVAAVFFLLGGCDKGRRKNNEQFKLSTRRQQLNNSKTHGERERKREKN
jgi:hypothetical protein